MIGPTRRAFICGIAGVTSAVALGCAQGAGNGQHPVARRAVRSADGTEISYARTGVGRPIVFSHGSLESGQEWLGLAALLADRHTCFVVDRRGRAQSGPAGDHGMARECEDIEAVLIEAGPSAALMGASYGAIVALETALRTPVERLIVYEPPLLPGVNSELFRRVNEHFDAYRKLVDEGRLDDAAVLGLEGFAAVPPAAVAEMRVELPDAWRAIRDLTPSWVPEIAAIRALPPGIDRYRRLGMPMLLVRGSESPEFLREVIAELHAALPHSSVLDLQGAGHEAHQTAPQLLADGIEKFLGETARLA